MVNASWRIFNVQRKYLSFFSAFNFFRGFVFSYKHSFDVEYQDCKKKKKKDWKSKKFTVTIDGLKIHLGRVWNVFKTKILGRGSMMLKRISSEVYTFCVLLHFFKQVIWKIILGGVLFHTPLPLYLPLCDFYAKTFWVCKQSSQVSKHFLFHFVP